MKAYFSVIACVAGLAIGASNSRTLAQAPGGAASQGQAAPAAQARPNPLPTFDTSRPAKLDIVEAKARYRVQEQLVGINFPNDAVGSTDSVTGVLVIAPDGSIGSQSKFTVDMKTFKSDQELRDNYLRTRFLETDKFPMLEFVPKRTEGLPAPLPSPPQSQAIGFRLIGDMTLKGVTKEAIWTIAGTLRGGTVAGRATTTLTFSNFGLPKPAVPLLLSVEDAIQLEIEFRASRSAL